MIIEIESLARSQRQAGFHRGSPGWLRRWSSGKIVSLFVGSDWIARAHRNTPAPRDSREAINSGDALVKLIVAIVQAYDTDRVLRSVTSAGFSVTRIQSTGGFLRSGNSTVLLGVDDERVHECLQLIRAGSCSRIENVPTELEAEFFELSGGEIANVAVGGAVVFVLPIVRFERMTVDAQAGCKSLA